MKRLQRGQGGDGENGERKERGRKKEGLHMARGRLRGEEKEKGRRDKEANQCGVWRVLGERRVTGYEYNEGISAWDGQAVTRLGRGVWGS